MEGNDLVEVQCQIEWEKELAMLITSVDTGVRDWVPLSQVSRITRRRDATGIDTVYMKEWIALKKGFI